MSDIFDLKRAYVPGPVWSTERILPEGFLPMLSTSAAGPLDSEEHAYEVRWEGLRVLAGLESSRLFLRSGTGQESGDWFPEMAALRKAAMPEWVLLDGELVVMQENLPSPAALRRRITSAASVSLETLVEELPVTYVVYDILRIGDSWLLDVNWDERRDILTRAVDLKATPQLKLSPIFGDGAGALRHAKSMGLEAVIGKRLRGRYYPGEKTRDWLNIKPMEVVDAVICGWTEGRGARAGSIGTLLLGLYQGEDLVYIGHTGTGMDAMTLRTLHQDLLRWRHRSCPFRGEPEAKGQPNWVVPKLVCRVRHQGWTETGVMRSATFVGMVGERPAGECLLPDEAAAAVR